MIPLLSAFSLSAVLFALPLQFTLKDTNGSVHTPGESSKTAIVIFFTTTDCPLSNGYVPEMNRIAQNYGQRGIEFYAVQTDTTIPEADVKHHANEFQYSFPVLLDPTQLLVRLAGATATPEVAVLSSSGRVLYLGRIDNRVEDFDRRRSIVTEFDLRNALDAVLAGKPVSRERTAVVGCGINFVKQETKR